MDEQSEGEHVLTVRLVLCVLFYVCPTVMVCTWTGSSSSVCAALLVCVCVYIGLSSCVILRWSGVMVCANEWGRWSVHFTRREKGSGVRMITGWEAVASSDMPLEMETFPFYSLIASRSRNERKPTETVMAAWRSGTRRTGRKRGERQGVSGRGGWKIGLPR